MPNTNFQTIFQMPGIVNNIVKQATGRDAVSQIDMDFVTVGQDKQTVQHEIDFTSTATFVNNNQLPLTVLAKITATQSGEGDPAPDNVRPITGRTGVTITQTGGETENTYSITFPETPGTVYGGVLNVTTGVLTVTRANVDLGTLNWEKSAGKNNLFNTTNVLSTGAYGGTSNSVCKAICSHYLADSPVHTYSNEVNETFTFTATGLCYIEDTDYSDAVTFKTAMSGVQLVYELATPVTYQLTATEIDSLIGENNLSADTGDVSVSYTSYIPVL